MAKGELKVFADIYGCDVDRFAYEVVAVLSFTETRESVELVVGGEEGSYYYVVVYFKGMEEKATSDASYDSIRSEYHLRKILEDHYEMYNE